jgi:hypothetical protein
LSLHTGRLLSSKPGTKAAQPSITRHYLTKRTEIMLLGHSFPVYQNSIFLAKLRGAYAIASYLIVFIEFTKPSKKM